MKEAKPYSDEKIGKAHVAKVKKEKKGVKLNPPPIAQIKPPYSVVDDLANAPAKITFGQLFQLPQFRKDVRKALTPKRSKAKGVHWASNKPENSRYTPIICKAECDGWKFDLIIDTGSSTSIISKEFMKHLKRFPIKDSV